MEIHKCTHAGFKKGDSVIAPQLALEQFSELLKSLVNQYKQ